MIKNLNYELIGMYDPAIVFLHGWGMSGEAFNSVIENITSNHKVLKLDFFSFGKSDDAEEWFDTYEYAYYIFLHIKDLELSEVILVGHSFGGRVAMILSSVFDLKIKTIVLTSSAGLNRFNLIKYVKIKYYKFIKFLVRKKILSIGVLEKFGSVDYKKLTQKNRKIFTRVVNQDLTYLLKKITIKTYLVWDKKDDITPYWICKKLNKTLINPNNIIYKNGKHYAFLYNNIKFSKLINYILKTN